MTSLPNLQPYWMPFTGNRFFKEHPLMLAGASGVHYTTHDGRQVLDAISGLWCCNAGHCHPQIVGAIQEQAGTLDYATAFQLGHPKVFELADRLTRLAPAGLDYAFFVNSGSEAVDTALKIALAYHRTRGEGHRTRFIGRERGYHGVGFGGISVGGVSLNRKRFGAMLPGVDHLPHTHSLAHAGFSRGQPEWGAHLADDLERIIALHDASTIAGVIIEPVLIFDEVITGFGRTGSSFAAETFGVQPELMTVAKGLTNGAVPMGGVIVDKRIYETFMTGPERAVEFFHGYTYSGHPLAAAAGLAALDVYLGQGLFARAAEMAPAFEDALHGLKGQPHVIDIRNFGMMGAVELEPRSGEPGLRALDLFRHCFDAGVLVRVTGDTVALTPPLIISESQIAQITDAIGAALQAVS
jgi:beta-alanine--pyruvate transaminase